MMQPKKTSKKLLPSLVLGLVMFCWAWFWANQKHLRESHKFVCQMVAEKSLFAEVSVKEWTAECLKKADQLSLFSNKKDLLDNLQNQLDKVGYSHLRVYGPVEDKRLWQGRALDTGIRTWEVDGRFIVAEVFPGSVANQAGVRPGDIIILAGGRASLSRWQMQTASGRFQFDRGGKLIEINLEPTEIAIDQSPQLSQLEPGVGLLKISSFRSEYFEAQAWKNLASQLKLYPKLILDLRDNSGGNFVAMLRALSPFVCKGPPLGLLVKPRLRQGPAEAFKDNISDIYQIEHIENFKEVPLVAFEDYGCFQGKAIALVNFRTSSVAEIFAQAFVDHPQHTLLGEVTAGDVVLAIWYKLPQLGEGYSISLPEAIYETSEGQALESVGVYPEARAFYQLEDAVLGRDSWLVMAVQQLKGSVKKSGE